MLARTLKGKGLIGIEGLEHWHGKALDKDTAAKVIAELEKHLTGADDRMETESASGATRQLQSSGRRTAIRRQKPPYVIGGKEVATRRGLWRRPGRTGEGGSSDCGARW